MSNTRFNVQIGTIVHYVLKEGKRAGETRAAMITNAWPSDDGHANLTVFPDEANDHDADRFASSAPYDDSPCPAHGSWRMIDHGATRIGDVGPSDPPDPGAAPPTKPLPRTQA